MSLSQHRMSISNKVMLFLFWCVSVIFQPPSTVKNLSYKCIQALFVAQGNPFWLSAECRLESVLANTWAIRKIFRSCRVLFVTVFGTRLVRGSRKLDTFPYSSVGTRSFQKRFRLWTDVRWTSEFTIDLLESRRHSGNTTSFPSHRFLSFSSPILVSHRAPSLLRVLARGVPSIRPHSYRAPIW